MATQPQFQEFPKILHHPNHRPATTRIIPNAPGTPGILKPGSEGTPIYLPDVTVVNEDEQAQYEAKGYRPVGTPDPTAYERAVNGTPLPDADIQRFPKWKYHATKEACIVETEAAERALGAGWADRPDLVVPEQQPSSAPAGAAADKPERAAAAPASLPARGERTRKNLKRKGKAKKSGWTPERRAAQSAVMKARIEAKKQAQPGE